MSQEYTDFLGINDSQILKDRGIVPLCLLSAQSTNTLAREYALSGGHAPALFVADTQTGGRGRMGRSFFSPAGTGIYMTLLLDITGNTPASIVALTSAAAVAVAESIQEVTGANGKIKWVNDIYVNGRKACGILAESFAAENKKYVAVGVGVNLSTDSFPEELDGIAGSLCVSDVQGVRRELTQVLAASLFDTCKALNGGDFTYMNEYRRRSLVLGKEVTFTRNGISSSGMAETVNDDGSLCVRLPNGETTTLSSGEISLRVK